MSVNGRNGVNVPENRQVVENREHIVSIYDLQLTNFPAYNFFNADDREKQQLPHTALMAPTQRTPSVESMQVSWTLNSPSLKLVPRVS